MPELPEVEVLVRHLRPLLRDKKILKVQVRREKVLAPTSPRVLRERLQGSRFLDVSRRGKYLLFLLRRKGRRQPFVLVGHLGMTGRMYVLPAGAALPKHAAVVLGLGRRNFVFEDTRYFGRFTLDYRMMEKLGPEPLGENFTKERFTDALKRSRQAIKVKLLDQSVVAGVGNIYASEALFRAGVPPRLQACRLTRVQIERLRAAVRDVLAEAIHCGSTVPLDYSGVGPRDALFYFGRAPGTPDYYEERLRVYDRAGRPCSECGAAIKRIAQAGRSTYYCTNCQRHGRPRAGAA